MHSKLTAYCFFFIVLAFFSRTSLAKEGFQHYGSWSNVEVSESEYPHASGFELTLWRYKRELVGYLSQYVGPVSDPPIGRVQNLVLNENTGAISFTAKMTLGVIYSAEEKKWVPSKDLYSFVGDMKKDRIVGTFDSHFKKGEEKGKVKEEVILKGGIGTNEFWDSKTYEQWKEFYAPIVKYRGPKW
jgi:hypothetical protein